MNQLVFLKTDTLPTEIPLIFSNHNLYKFVESRKEMWNNIEFVGCKEQTVNSVPLIFFAKKNECDVRKLSLIHPFAQMQLTKFVEKYDGMIINFFQQQNLFSIRAPIEINNIQLEIPKKYIRELRWLLNSREEIIDKKEEEFISNYFNVSKFAKITDFYKSFYMKDLELKYKYLLKLDYKNCFDSIYTHAIDWAYLGSKEIAKENISNKDRFSYQLDQIIRAVNYNETNGIVIGPEFSRTVAEFVLTRIDRDVYYQLLKLDVIYKKHYEIVRFIDDIFVFYNNEDIGRVIESEIIRCSLEYKMHINNEKKSIQKKPFLREQLWVSELKVYIQKYFNYFKENEIQKKRFSHDNFYENFRLAITRYEPHRRYIVSYALSTIERKLSGMLIQLQNTGDSELLKYHCCRSIDLILYILNYYVSADNVLKVGRMILKFQRVAQEKEIYLDSLIFKKVFNLLEGCIDDSCDILNFIIILAFNDEFLPQHYLSELIKKNKSYFALAAVAYYIITKDKNIEFYKNTVDEINKIIADYIEEMNTRYSLYGRTNSDVNSFDAIDDSVLSNYFYIIHDFFSSGLLNQENIRKVNLFKNMISKQKNKKEAALYNIFLEYIEDFNKPFMHWETSHGELLKNSLVRKYRVRHAYE